MSHYQVLLVEDNPDDGELFLQAASEAGLSCRVEIAADAEQAIVRIFDQDQKLPDLILLDIKMQGVNGLQFLRMLRNVRGRDFLLPPVVMFTSSDDSKDLTEAYITGVNGYVRKPVQYARYVEVVQQVLLYWLLINQSHTQEFEPAVDSKQS